MSFAFKLAKKEFEKRYPSANTEPLRMDDLPENLAFNRIFTKAKARVSKMSVRFVEIKYRRERTDFEMYAHMELGTPFNNL